MYPLFKKSVLAGVISAAAATLLFQSINAGFAFFVLFFCAGALWREEEPPILSFAVAFQWLFIVSGYLYAAAGGDLGEYRLIGNVDLAVALSLIGLVCVTAGMRLGLALVRRQRSQPMSSNINIKPLFLLTIVVYSTSWIFNLSPMDSSSVMVFNAAQVLTSILNFREVLFCLLWILILQRRQDYRFGWIALLVALLPRFTSRQSTFKELIFMVLVVTLIQFKPWITTAAQRSRNRQIAYAFVLATIALFLAGIVWEGAVKPVWRNLEFDSTSQIETLDTFARVAATTTSEMQEESSIRAFISRVSSITQFALVLDRVPTVVPFENGYLTKRALIHVVVPRILFPGKEPLPSDSVLAEEYAGINVGEDTSVGIGYMAEFYVDWGMPWMFPCLLALGFFLGVAYQSIYLFTPNFSVANAVVIVPFMGNFITFEATLPKLLGGFIMTTIILSILSRGIPTLVRTVEHSSRLNAQIVR